MEHIIIISCLILLILCAYFTFPHNRQKNHQNKVHFYVARDRDKSLWLYMGKPTRDEDYEIWIVKYRAISDDYGFKNVGLNENDYKDLKWEDEPVEVFLNLED